MNPFRKKTFRRTQDIDPEDYIDMSDFDGSRPLHASYLRKIARVALKGGNQIVEKALYLFYAASNKNTPAWARRIIYGALAYLILPVDAIPDFIPGVGFTDDLGVITAALATVAFYVTPEIKQKARQTKQKWFGRLNR